MYNFLQKNKMFLIYIPLAVYWIILFILTSLPGDNVPQFALNDKIKHFGAYFILSVLLSLTLHFQRKNEKVSAKFVFYTVISIIIYATFDELHQIFIPGRTAEFLDWLANLAGCLLGTFLVNLFIKRNSRRFEIIK